MKRLGLGIVLSLASAAVLLLAACDSDDGDGVITCDPACEAGQICTNEGECVDQNEGVTCDPACADDEICTSDGTCVARTTPTTCDPACGAGQVCTADGTCADVAATCEPACDAGQVCTSEGTCADVAADCEPACGADEACTSDGTCVAVAVTCDPACEAGQACATDGTCVDLAVTCDPACGPNEVCDAGTCVAVVQACDPDCLEGEVCVNGTCLPTSDHATFALLEGPFESGPEVTAACRSCHESQLHDVMQSAHYQWRGPNPGMQDVPAGEQYGKDNIINNFCIAVVSNEARCTQCHAGYGYDDGDFAFDEPNSVDCLVCHDQSGQYVKDMKKAGTVAEGVDLTLAAKSVGSPTRDNCGACHFFAGGGDNVKKGDLGSWAFEPTDEADVHMGAHDMQCVDCHTATAHRISGGGLHVPVEEESLACTDCHQGPVVHEDNDTLDQHTAHVACETCHIPAYSRQQPTKLEWYWEFAGDQEREPVLDEYGMPDYNAKKGEFVWGQDVEPTLAWYNGTYDRMVIGDTYDSEPVALAEPHGSIDDPAAKIYPFKVMKGNQPADTVNMVLAVPHLFGKIAGDNPYWGTWDWDLAIQEGMAAAGLDFSGTYGFVETEMYMKLHHEVTGQARDCTDCHNGGIDFVALGYSGDPMSVGGEHATE
ncbi:MAG: tetrathionate reductase family octaheme c-type cytochrome [Myxococcota bacterium]